MHGTCPNFMDPLCPMPVPTTVSAGKALPHTALATHELVLQPGHEALVFACSFAGCATVGYQVIVDNTGQVAGGGELYHLPTLTASAMNNGCTSSRAMRLSCSVINTTNVMNRGGDVYYINSAQRLPEKDQNSGFSRIMQAIKTHPTRRVVGGDRLLGTKQAPSKLLAYPTDMPKYHEFEEHTGAVSDDGAGVDQYLRHLVEYVGTGTPPALGPLPRSMSIIVYYFENPPQVQTYRITMRGSMYTRWPMTSVPGYHMRAIPAVPAHVYNHVVDHAEAQANTLQAATEGGVIATVGPKLLQGAGAAGKAFLSIAKDVLTGSNSFTGGAAEAGAEEGMAGVIEMLAPAV